MENRLPGQKPSLSSETGIKNHPGIYVGVEDDGDYQTDVEEDDGLGDIWNEMSMGLETNKVSFMYILYYNNMFLCYVHVFYVPNWKNMLACHMFGADCVSSLCFARAQSNNFRL